MRTQKEMINEINQLYKVLDEIQNEYNELKAEEELSNTKLAQLALLDHLLRIYTGSEKEPRTNLFNIFQK